MMTPAVLDEFEERIELFRSLFDAFERIEEFKSPGAALDAVLCYSPSLMVERRLASIDLLGSIQQKSIN